MAYNRINYMDVKEELKKGISSQILLKINNKTLSLAYKINLLIPNCSLRIYSNIFNIFSIDRLLLIAFVISRREFNLNSFMKYR